MCIITAELLKIHCYSKSSEYFSIEFGIMSLLYNNPADSCFQAPAVKTS